MAGQQSFFTLNQGKPPCSGGRKDFKTKGGGGG